MSRFLGRVTHALLDPVSPAQRGDVEAFVQASLADLPQHLQIGIALDSILLEGITRLTHEGAIPDDATLRSLVERWETNPLTPIRQWARLVSSLVLFADQETRPAGTGTES